MGVSQFLTPALSPVKCISVLLSLSIIPVFRGRRFEMNISATPLFVGMQVLFFALLKF